MEADHRLQGDIVCPTVWLCYQDTAATRKRSHLVSICPGAAAGGAGHLLPCVCVCARSRFVLFPTEWNLTFTASNGAGGWFYRLTC